MPLPTWNSLRNIRGSTRPSLAQTLAASWWLIAGLLAILLIADAVVFYRYGVTSSPPGLETGESVSVHEQRIRQAASLIEERRSSYQATAPPGADLPNPFR